MTQGHENGAAPAKAAVERFHEDVENAFTAYPEEGFAITDDIDGKSFWMRSRNRTFGRELERLVAGRDAPRVLEIGCGNGSFLKHVSSTVKAEFTGSEIYSSGVESARKKLPGVRVLQLDATRMPFRSEFDVICAFDVLEHIEEDEVVMEGVRRALKPGGAFMISVPQYPWMWTDLDDLVHHRRRYTRKALHDKLTRAGLTVEYMTSHVFALFPAMLASRVASKFGKSKNDTRTFTEFGDLANTIGDRIMRFDEALIRRQFSLPFGGTLYAVGRA